MKPLRKKTRGDTDRDRNYKVSQYILDSEDQNLMVNMNFGSVWTGSEALT